MRLGKLLADLVVALDQLRTSRRGLPRRPAARSAGGQIRFLRQEADADAGLRAGLALEFLVDAGHDPQQRGFAGAVEAEHADLGAREKAE